MTLNSEVPHLEIAEEQLWQAGHPRTAEALHKEVQLLIEDRDRLHRIVYPGPFPVNAGAESSEAMSANREKAS